MLLRVVSGRAWDFVCFRARGISELALARASQEIWFESEFRV